MLTGSFRKNLRLNSRLPALCPPWLLSLSTPGGESLGFIFPPVDIDLPHLIRTTQLYPHLHLYQSELIYNNSLKFIILTNQNYMIQANENGMNLDTSFAWSWINWGPGWGTLYIKSVFPIVSVECTFSFHQRLCFLSLQTVHMNKGSLFSNIPF